MPRVLTVYASPRGEQSDSRKLAHELAERLAHGGEIVVRDLSATELAPVTATQIEAYNFSPDQHQPHHREAVALSDALIAEIKAADIIVIGTPMYNFTVPGTLKLWIDLVARPGHTFRYTAHGPVGLLEGKKAFFVVTTGGTPLGSPYDHLTGYLQTFFAFIGITDSRVVGAAQLMADESTSIGAARAQIASMAA